MIQSHSFRWRDFQTAWYKHWAREMLQNKSHLDGHALFANKFWQNAAMAQALYERGAVNEKSRGIGFGVGQERLPALFAKYDVFVTATDQDFKAQKAGHWAKRELATGQQSLNKLGICDQSKFIKQVEYEPVDMTKIPEKLFGEYDFLWSNCALGHLGSIPAGLAFIKESLKCLKPGGWAVHTTEVNILSNAKTVDDGSTVIFRVRDIYRLQRSLIVQGYEVSPFVLTLGKDPEDRRISLAPIFGNDYSKIQFRGHLLTQIVLIIHKPKKFPKKTDLKTTTHRLLAVRRAYRSNLRIIKNYRRSDPTIRQINLSKKAPVSKIKLMPAKSHIKIKINRGKLQKLPIVYKNNTDFCLFGVISPISANPIVLATADPVNRKSKFKSDSWASNNRPSAQLWAEVSKGKYKQVEFVQPRQNFMFELTLNTKGLKKGSYQESFCLVQELVGWIDSSTVKISIEII